MLLPAGIVLCNLILCYLCKMVYVISGMSATEEVRQLTCAAGPSDWLADPHGSAEVGKAGLPQSQSSLRS